MRKIKWDPTYCVIQHFGHTSFLWMKVIRNESGSSSLHTFHFQNVILNKWVPVSCSVFKYRSDETQIGCLSTCRWAMFEISHEKAKGTVLFYVFVGCLNNWKFNHKHYFHRVYFHLRAFYYVLLWHWALCFFKL